MANERLRFWEEKLGENQHILAMLDAGQFRSRAGDVPDEQTLAEVRHGRHAVWQSVKPASLHGSIVCVEGMRRLSERLSGNLLAALLSF